MLTLMVGRVEDVILSIFIRELTTHTQTFFSREISIPSPQIHRKCFNTCLLIFLSSIDLQWRVLVGLLMFSGAIIHQKSEVKSTSDLESHIFSK
jgi:hypothetical protein